jgi:hypothetical protein
LPTTRAFTFQLILITITRSLDAGDYFIVVDSAYDLPGEYTLSVYFE